MSTHSILRHVRNYASAGVVSGLVGLASFPIIARNLSVGDYGIIGLITASTTLAAAFGKLGIQHAIVRFYAPAMRSEDPRELLSLHSTVFVLFAALSLIATGLWIFTGQAIMPRLFDNPDIDRYFLLVSGVIILRLVGSANWNLLRARQESRAVSMSTVIGRGSYLIMLLLLLLAGQINLSTLLVMFVFAELAGVVWAVYAYRPWFSFSLHSYSREVAVRLIRFGLPLMVLESLSILLRLIDRYMVGSVLGEGPLGLYAASYNLCSYIELVVTASLAAAIRPMYTDIWAKEGESATKEFLERGLHIYLMVGIPFIAVFNLVAPELLHFLASDRYEAGTSIIPWISTAILLDGSLIFLSAGMYFLGSTNTVLKWGLISGTINAMGNYVVIPHFGITGAASVTLVAFLVFAIGLAGTSMRLLSWRVSWRRPLVMLLLSLLLTLPLYRLDVGEPLVNLVARGALGCLLLGGLLLIIDSDVRRLAIARLRIVRCRLS